jgi:hypothetical protein
MEPDATTPYPIYWQLSSEVSSLFQIHPSSSLCGNVQTFYRDPCYNTTTNEGMMDGYLEREEWNEDLDEKFEGEEEEGSDPEFELSMEIVERFAHTEMRRRQRRKEELEKEKAKEEALAAELLTEKLTKEQKQHLYGHANYTKQLEPLEERLRSLFERKKDQLRPSVWPELPMNPYPNKKKSRALVLKLVQQRFDPS